MKRVLLIIVSFLFCTVVYATSTYSQAQELANDYIKRFPNYQRYMITRNAKYGFNSSNNIVNNSNYKTGGLINEQEYKISAGSINSSYLFNGLTFFTMTESGNQVKIIDPKVANGIDSQNKVSASSGVRVTGYVSSEIQLRGNGTRVSPWKFIDRYNVIFEYDDTKIKVSPSTTTVSAGGWAKVNVTPTAQYTYVPQTTCGKIEDGVLKVTGVNSDVVCKIDHALREYTVNIDANGGTFSDTMHSSLGWDLTEGNTKATKKILYNAKVGNLPTSSHVSRVGYDFDGVFEGDTAINSNHQIKKDTELTVRWKGKKYKVTYEPNGGSVTPTFIEQTYGDPYTGLHSPSRTGYEFVAWYKNSGLTETYRITVDDTIVNTASDHTIYARWEANKYTVTFDANGGSVSPSTKEVTYDNTYGTLPTPTKSGYTFDGWYLETSFTNRIKSTDTVKIVADTTLHAKWLQKVTIPTDESMCNNKTYNGGAQTIVKTASEGFEWTSGSSQINVGTYTVTASIKPGYIWANETTNDKSINCSIIAKNVSVTWGNTTSFTYNESAQAPTASVTTGVSGETMAVTRTTKTAVGNYTSTASCSSVTGGQAKCSNYKLTNTTKDYTIVQREVTITAPTVNSSTLTYSGSAQNLLATSGSCTAGGKMYWYASNPTTSSTKPTFSTSSGWTTTAPSSTSYKGTNAGTYYIWYYCYVSDTTNNKAASGSTINSVLSVTKVINKYTPSITLSVETGSVDANSTNTFTASPTTISSCQGTLTAASANTSYVTITDGASNSNVASGSTKTITYKGVGYTTGTNINVNYAPTDTANCASAAQKQISISVARIANSITITCKSLTYSGSAQVLINSVTVSGGTPYYKVGTSLTSSNYSSTGSSNTSTVTGTNVGEYTIYYYIAATSVYSAKSGNKKCSIGKYTPSIALGATNGSVNINATGTFTATPTTISKCQGTLTAASANTNYVTITDGASNSNVASGTAKTITYKGIAYTTGTNINVNYAPTDTDNCSSASQKTFSAKVNKLTPTINLTDKSATYTGSAIGGNAASATYNSNSISLSYTYTYYTNSGCSTKTSSSSGGAASSGAAPKNAGTWYYKAVSTETDTYASASSACKVLTINAKKLDTPSVSITTAGKVTWGAITNADSYQVKINSGSWEAATSGSKSIPTDTTGTHTAYVRALGPANFATSDSGSASATISNKIIVSYEKTKKKCEGSFAFDTNHANSYNIDNGCSTEGSVGTCNNANVNSYKKSCVANRWTRSYSECVADTSNTTMGCTSSCEYTVTTNNCTQTCTCAHGTYSNGSCPNYTGTEHTDTKSKTCSESCPANYTLTANTCSTKYTKKTYKCYCHENGGEAGGNDPACGFALSSTKDNTGCYSYELSCSNKNHVGNTKVECLNPNTTGSKTCTKTWYTCDDGTSQTSPSCSQSPSCSYTSSSYKICSKTTYKWKSGSDYVTDYTSCGKTSGGSCSSASDVGNKSYSGSCTVNRYRYTETKCVGSYSFGDTVITPSVPTKDETENIFSSCNSTYYNKYYIKYANNYDCSNGTSPVGDKCIKIN